MYILKAAIVKVVEVLSCFFFFKINKLEKNSIGLSKILHGWEHERRKFAHSTINFHSNNQAYS